MRRREVLRLFSGVAAAWPLAARAQQAARLARIGYLGLTSASVEHAAYGGSDVFLTALRDLGYVEGRNLHIEFRFSGGDEDRLAGLAAELVALNVDVIVTYATGVNAAQRATATIPIVAATAGDMVAMGISRASGRQHHRIDLLRPGALCETIGAAQGSRAIDDPSRPSLGSK